MLLQKLSVLLDIGSFFFSVYFRKLLQPLLKGFIQQRALHILYINPTGFNHLIRHSITHKKTLFGLLFFEFQKLIIININLFQKPKICIHILLSIKTVFCKKYRKHQMHPRNRIQRLFIQLQPLSSPFSLQHLRQSTICNPLLFCQLILFYTLQRTQNLFVQFPVILHFLYGIRRKSGICFRNPIDLRIRQRIVQ